MKLTQGQHIILTQLLRHFDDDNLFDIYTIDLESPLADALLYWIESGHACCTPAARRVITALAADPRRYGFSRKSRRPLDAVVCKEHEADNARSRRYKVKMLPRLPTVQPDPRPESL